MTVYFLFGHDFSKVKFYNFLWPSRSKPKEENLQMGFQMGFSLRFTQVPIRRYQWMGNRVTSRGKPIWYTQKKQMLDLCVFYT